MNSAPAAPLLVGDIGGTHARFAHARPAPDGRVMLEDIRQYATAEHASLSDALAQFLAATCGHRPQRAVLAIASAVTGDRVKITNNPWSFSAAELGQELGCAVTLINDFAAVSIALPSLAPADLLRLGPELPPPEPRARRCYAVVGPGTGLGVGGLIVEDGRCTVMESEAGHLAFAPDDDVESELLAALRARFERVSVERLLSGAGLVNLYAALCAIAGLSADDLKPEDITARASADRHGMCARALGIAGGLLGSFAGDIVLAFGAWDGLYLHGGVAQKLQPWLEQESFRRRFEAKGRHSAMMQRIPTQLILHPQAGLLGAAVHGSRA